jgi:uncharacterized membrane protein
MAEDLSAPGAPTAETARLEAFSDGVFAVAITLLALELKVPAVTALHGGHHLAAALLDEWPMYLAYALSFLSILIVWVNHHHLFLLIRRTDHGFLLLNGFLLMVVTSIPFATQLLATYLATPDQRVAEVVYSGMYLLVATTYSVMWRYAAHGKRLIDAGMDARTVQRITGQFRFGPVVYLLAFGLAFLSAQASLVLCAAIAIFFALPIAVTRALAPVDRSSE